MISLQLEELMRFSNLYKVGNTTIYGMFYVFQYRGDILEESGIHFLPYVNYI